MPDRILRTGSFLSMSATQSCWSMTANLRTGKGNTRCCSRMAGAPSSRDHRRHESELPNIDDNVAAWRNLVKAARASGLRISRTQSRASVIPSYAAASGAIDATQANHSEGANRIIDAANRLSLPYRPLVVVTGGRLTDVADAYLIDRR
jgi:hypothetical protein